MEIQIRESGAACVVTVAGKLDTLTSGDYEKASREMLDSKWAREDSPNRANALANKIKTIRRGK